MKTCWLCAALIDLKAEKCEHCGATQPLETEVYYETAWEESESKESRRVRHGRRLHQTPGVNNRRRERIPSGTDCNVGRVQEQKPVAYGRRCRYCGRILHVDATFCSSCGNPV